MQQRYWQRLVFFDGAEVVCLEVMVMIILEFKL